MMETLSQQLRENVHLPPLINKGGFHSQRMKKIGRQVKKKSSPSFFFSANFLSLYLRRLFSPHNLKIVVNNYNTTSSTNISPSFSLLYSFFSFLLQKLTPATISSTNAS
jgi:hypothetical protein